ncbi:MAG: GntR family transcriptional regulator [Armatimonadota bacterium]|nr:GntR family transcriptional regulator [bacterium]
MANSLPDTIARDILTEYVQNGDLKPGDSLPPVRELQKKYATSRSTVLHALSILETQGILEKRRGSGCYLTEQGLDIGRTSPNMIGFIGYFTGAEITNRIYEGVESICRRRGYHVIFGMSNSDYQTEQEQVDRTIQAGCQAIVLFPASRSKEQLRNDYLKTKHTNFPIVLVDLAHPEQKRSQVVFDNYHAGYEMTKLLIRDGHSNIAFMMMDLGDGWTNKSTYDRYKGYRDALAEEGLPHQPHHLWLLKDNPYIEPQAQCVMPFLLNWSKQPDKPTALIALEDCAAMDTINIARQIGIQVPDELTVVGFDNCSYAASFSPAFTTTDPDFVRAGEMAADLAISHIKGKQKTPIVYTLPVPIKERKEIAMEYERLLSQGKVSSPVRN